MSKTPPRFECTITTRGYELDRNSFVPPAVLLRYMEQVRWEAVASPELKIGSLFRNGQRIVVRAQQLEHVAPVGLGTKLTASMWMGRVGRASLDIHHELRLASSGEAVARGIVTGVFLDATGTPARVPDEMREDVDPACSNQIAPALDSQAPRDAWIRRIVVRPSDLDVFQHVNHANYLVYFEDTRSLASEQGVYGKREAKRLLRVNIDYRREARENQELDILTWTLADNTIGFELRRVVDDERLSQARMELET